MIVIPHKKFEKFNHADKQYYQEMDLNRDKLDIDSISWEGIEKNYFQFWGNLDKCKEYVMHRKFLTKRGKKPFKIPDTIKSHEWTISVDLICTGLVLKVFSSVPEALDFFGKYWEYARNDIFSEFGATLEHVRAFIDEETEVARNANKILVDSGMKPKKIHINPKRLKSRLDKLQSEGALDISPRHKEIGQIMNQLGWKLTTRGWTEK